MEFEIARGYEIKRLTPENMIYLHTLETNKGRCFMPWEIQEFFHLQPLKTVYLIPEIEAAQASHHQRVRKEFYEAGIYPKYQKLSPLDIDEIHQFDERIVTANIDFVYSGSKKRSLKDEVNHWAEQ